MNLRRVILILFVVPINSKIVATIDSSCTTTNNTKFRRDFTRYGANKIPKIYVSNVHKKYYAVLLVDKNPVAKSWVHWIKVNIPRTVTSLPNPLKGRSTHLYVIFSKVKFDNKLFVKKYFIILNEMIFFNKSQKIFRK